MSSCRRETEALLIGIRREIEVLSHQMENIRVEVVEAQTKRVVQFRRQMLGMLALMGVVLSGGILHLKMSVNVTQANLAQTESNRQRTREILYTEIAMNKDRHDLLMSRLDLLREMLNWKIRKQDP